MPEQAAPADVDGYANMGSWGSFKAMIMDLVLNSPQGMFHVVDRGGQQFIRCNQIRPTPHVPGIATAAICGALADFV